MATVTIPRSETTTRAQAPGTTKNKGKGGPKGRRTNLPLLAAAILLIVGSAVVIGWVFSVSGDRTAVLVSAKDIPAGHVITEQDLGEAQVAGSGISAIRASDKAALLGKRTIGALPAGVLMARGLVTGDALPGQGQVALGLSLKAGQMPPEVTPGRTVDVVSTPAQGGSGDTRLLAHAASVVSVNSTGSNNGWTVTVAVPEGSSLDVAGAAAASRVALVLLPMGSS